MNILLHIIINGIVGLLLGLNNLEFAMIIFGAFLIDIDHIFYQYFVVKNKSIKEMLKWHYHENSIKRPHFYFLHQIEILFMLAFIFYFANSIFFWLIIGFIIHLITDFVENVLFHKSFHCAFKYYTLIGYLTI